MSAATITCYARQQTEKEFQTVVVQYARLLGYRVYHTHDSRRSEPGFPDLVLVREGRLLVAELKRQTGRTSPAQQEWLELLRSAGVDAYIWRPSDWDEITEVLK